MLNVIEDLIPVPLGYDDAKGQTAFFRHNLIDMPLAF
jgi:hypothetical protein